MRILNPQIRIGYESDLFVSLTVLVFAGLSLVIIGCVHSKNDGRPSHAYDATRGLRFL